MFCCCCISRREAVRGALSSVSREATAIVVRELPAAWEASVLRGTLACHKAALVLEIGVCYYI